MLYDIVLGDAMHRLELQHALDTWSCRLDGEDIPIDVAQICQGTLSLVLNGRSYEIRRNGANTIVVGSRSYEVAVRDPRSWRGRKGAAAGESGPRKLTASMPGKVVRVLAAEGDAIEAGQGIVVVEAMKMQNEIKSPKEGKLQKLLVRAGMNVNSGDVLALVE